MTKFGAMFKWFIAAIVGVFLFSMLSCKKDMLHITARKLNSNTTSRLNRMRFINDSICIAAGGVQFEQSVIVRSTDGGYTWSAHSDLNAPKAMYGLGVGFNGNIYLSGIDGDVLTSKDNGSTWKFNRINTWLVYSGGQFVDADTGIFVASVLQRQCNITRVDSNFQTIDEQVFQFGLNNIYMTSPGTGYVVGYGAVMKTNDKGKTWQYQDVQGDNFSAMDIHGNEIWMCGTNGGIYHTEDGGEHWENLRNGNDLSLPRYMLRSIVFKDKFNGWATGDDGIVIRTDDGGHHWSEYERFTTSNLREIVICPNGYLLVAGDNGDIYRLN